MKSGVAAFLAAVILCAANSALGIRFPANLSGNRNVRSDRSLKIALFAMGNFWRSEAVFGCLDGVQRTSVGYAGGSATDPEYRKLRDHAECVQIVYDPQIITFHQLLDAFWSNHDSTQVFGQGPDVGNEYSRSIIFTNSTVESRLATASKEFQQSRSKDRVVTTQIQRLGAFYPAEPHHQKFELRRNPFYLLLLGNMSDEELVTSSLAAKLNGYAADLCPLRTQRKIDAKIEAIRRKGWPLLTDI
ncbi:hypothetical protein M569_02949 [Genlisea aurea]|uniref:Peptide methionine sulfoxide reductase A5 n=1 Tax=Genlisea aurea TaxID=192259 RepID=S8CWL7_9LAMI|nr:hypothetical protein M569_02949 [Genlisea aurea]